MKKSWIYMVAVATMFMGCQSDDSGEGNVADGSHSFTASFEQTRAYLDDENYCRWNLNDQVSFFNEDGDHYTYYSTKDDVTTTVLSTSESADFSDGNIYALFPYSETNIIDGGVLKSVIPAEQVFDKNNVNMNNAIMVARIPSTHRSMMFKNSCSLIKVSLNTVDVYKDRISINSIKIESKANKLAGTVTIDDDNIAKITTDGSNTVTMTGCAEAGKIGTDYTTFVLVIPTGIYAADDLTITIDTDNDDFDYTAIFGKELNIDRSKYIVLHKTLAKKTDDVVNKAIMANKENLTAQGFSNVEHLDVLFELPTGDFTYDGEGKVYNFVTAKKEGVTGDIYIMNTFTTTQSGIEGVTPPHVEVKNITITGTLRGTSMGIWVHNVITGPGAQVKNYNTTFENVNIVNNNIIPWTEQEACGLAIFGTAYLKNCTVKGTKYTEEFDESSQQLYDVSVRNSATATFEGGEYGLLNGKEQSKITLKGGVKVDKYWSISVSASNLGYTKIEDAVINHAVIDPSGTYNPNLTVGSQAVITTLEFVGVTNFSKVTIADDAKITRIINDGVEYTSIADFKKAVGITK